MIKKNSKNIFSYRAHPVAASVGHFLWTHKCIAPLGRVYTYFYINRLYIIS